MDVTGRGKGDKQAKHDGRTGDEAAAQTQVDMVSQYAHPRGAKATFDLGQLVARHAIPVAVACLTLGGMIAAVLLKRRRRDTWAARIDRLRRSIADAANGAGRAGT